MTATCRQPSTFPSMYLMERYFKCDTIIVMGQAQYTKKGIRPLVVTDENGCVPLPVPSTGGNRSRFCDKYLISTKKWSEDTYNKLEANYQKYKGWPDIDRELSTFLGDLSQLKEVSLAYLGAANLRWLLQWLGGVEGTVVMDCDLVAERPDNPNDWIRQLLVECGESDYLQGLNGYSEYLDLDPEVNCYYQKFEMANYRPAYNCIDLSVIDCICSCGLDETRRILFNTGKTVIRYRGKG